MTGRPDEEQPPTVASVPPAESGLTDIIHHERAQGRPLAGTIKAGETAAEGHGAGTWQIEQGTDVLCDGGEKIGEVVEVMPGYLVVEQGFFDPHDIYVPIDLIAGHDETSLNLSMSREAFDREDWSEEPEAGGLDDHEAPAG